MLNKFGWLSLTVTYTNPLVGHTDPLRHPESSTWGSPQGWATTRAFRMCQLIWENYSRGIMKLYRGPNTLWVPKTRYVWDPELMSRCRSDQSNKCLHVSVCCQDSPCILKVTRVGGMTSWKCAFSNTNSTMSCTSIEHPLLPKNSDYYSSTKKSYPP